MVHVIDNYYIDISDDGRNYELIETYTGKTKKGETKDASRSLGYYGGFLGALNACAKNMAAERIGNSGELKDAIRIYKESFDKMASLLGGLDERSEEVR